MIKKVISPQDQVFWYLKRDKIPPLTQSLETEVLVIGGGMAGLSAAQACVQRGKKVVLLEQYYCGAGASGKSSGFITPNSELSLTDFINKYGKQGAKQIWDMIVSGMEIIRKNILEHKLECEYFPQDTLYLANNKKALNYLQEEVEDLVEAGYKSLYFGPHEVNNYINSDKYYGGLIYYDSFGIHAYKYCQAMKEVLQKQGVEIFEETPVTSIDAHSGYTLHATVKAKHIIICADRFIPEFTPLKKELFQAQTFLMISQVLSDQLVKQLFPHKSYMAWDTDLVYTYFRLTPQHRMLVGGGNIWQSYMGKEKHNYQTIVKKLSSYFTDKFGYTLQFEQLWPGLIGVSKDIVPIAGRDRNMPSIYYVGGAAGLPIACALGNYAAQHIFDQRTNLDTYFNPYRRYLISNTLQTLLGKRITFSLSNFFAAERF